MGHRPIHNCATRQKNPAKSPLAISCSRPFYPGQCTITTKLSIISCCPSLRLLSQTLITTKTSSTSTWKLLKLLKLWVRGERSGRPPHQGHPLRPCRQRIKYSRRDLYKDPIAGLSAKVRHTPETYYVWMNQSAQNDESILPAQQPADAYSAGDRTRDSGANSFDDRSQSREPSDTAFAVIS